MTTTQTDDTPPADLQSYLRVHRILLASAAQLADSLDGIGHPTPRRDRAITRWIAGFTGEIRCHHHIEDALLFPALAERVVTYEHEVGPLLAQDHADLDTLLDALDRASAVADWDVAAPLARQLDAHLCDHLGYEDRVIAGLFARHFSSEEFEELNVAAIKMVPLRQLPFTVPWTMAMLGPDDQADVLASAPSAMKVLWHLTRRRYERTTAIALGSLR